MRKRSGGAGRQSRGRSHAVREYDLSYKRWWKGDGIIE